MSLTIITFTADATEATIKINSSSVLIKADLILQDGTSLDILADFTSTGIDEYEAIVEGDFSDGVITADLRSAGDTLILSICNLLIGTQYLLSETIKEIFDCILMQQLEGIKQLVLANEGDLARSIYGDVLNKTASCSDAPMLGYQVSGTSISIIDSKYIIT